LNIFIIASFSNYYGDRMTETHLFLSPNISHESNFAFILGKFFKNS